MAKMTKAQRQARKVGRQMAGSAWQKEMDRRAGGRPASGSGNAGGLGG